MWRKILGLMNIENLMCIFVFILIGLGIYFDYLVLGKNQVIIVCNTIDEIALSLVGIIATFTTIIFSVIALVAGYIGKTYFGVSLTKYILDRNKTFLTYRNLIFFSIFLILCSICCNVIGCYNMVFGFLNANIFIVLIAIIRTYMIFDNPNKIKKEISNFVEYNIEQSSKFDEIDQIVTNLVDDFIKYNEITNEEFAIYNRLYFIGIKKLLDLDLKQGLVSIEHSGKVLIENLLACDKKHFQNDATSILIRIYDEIDNRLGQINDVEIIDFDLLYTFNDYLRDMRCNELINYLRHNDVQLIVFTVLKFKIHVKKISYNDEKFWGYVHNETSSLCDLSRIITSAINENRTNRDVNMSLLKMLLTNYMLSSSTDEQDKCIVAGTMIFYLDLCIKLLKNGETKLLKECFYLSYVDDKKNGMNKFEFLLILLVHGYLYYLATKECQPYVSKGVQENAQKLWNNPQIQNIYFTAITSYNFNDYEDVDILSLANIVSYYELMGNERCKVFKMHDYILEFYVFTLLLVFMDGEALNDCLDKYLNVNLLFDFLNDSVNKRKSFLEFSLIVYPKNNNRGDSVYNENCNEELLSRFYDDFEVKLKEIKKNELLTNASNDQKKYDENKVSIVRYVQSMFSDYKDKLNNLFKDLVSENLEGNTSKTCVNGVCTTSCLSEVTNDFIPIERVASSFFGSIVKELIKNKEVRIEDLSYTQTEQYETDLAQNNYKCMIGSDRILKRWCSNNKQLDLQANAYSITKVNTSNMILFLKKDAITIKIHDVNVNINEVENSSRYLNSQEELCLDKEDYEGYLKMNKKEISITILYSIRIKENCNCLLVKPEAKSI